LRSCEDPESALGRRKSAESGKTYPGAILLGPWIIAVDSPRRVLANRSRHIELSLVRYHQDEPKKMLKSNLEA
ncbi:hypothetical protein, partial [Candidatus Binatus sp.]|uniref:hypothetical protein n=1 Tax=Candidatus Binatus sp. TaxID=2811406 RepID=UPI003C517CE0